MANYLNIITYRDNGWNFNLARNQNVKVDLSSKSIRAVKKNFTMSAFLFYVLHKIEISLN
jgi:hypothetical protein